MGKIILIAAVDKKFGIGKNNSIPWHIPEDMKFFKEKTMRNIVVMGNNTFKSMNEKPLKNRDNIVLTRDFLNKNYFTIKPENLNYENSFELLDKTISNFLRHTEKDIYIIGGSSLYNYFINECHEMYITYIDKDYQCDTFCPKPSEDFLLINKEYQKHYSKEENTDYYFLHYERKPRLYKNENQYLNLIKYILDEGETKTDRTNVGTVSSFGHQMKFDISNRVPLLTTKRVPWKMVIEELLWFLRGDTDAKKLQEKNIHIWDGNTSREFLDNRGLHYEEGTLGPMYGWQLLHYGAEYDNCKTDYTGKGINQVERVLKMIKQEPNSRRILMTMYNPSDLEKGVLEPCHGIVIQFYVSKGKYLSCHMYQRSVDTGLGSSFNIFSYTVLTYILAMKTDLIPGELTISTGDTHVYTDHIEPLKKQLERNPHSEPKLFLDPSIKDKDFKDITINDFFLLGYFPEPTIKMKMAI